MIAHRPQPIIDCALEPIRQDARAIAQGREERRQALLETKAIAAAGREVALCIDGVRGLGREVTPALGHGLAELAIHAYFDSLGRQ